MSEDISFQSGIESSNNAKKNESPEIKQHHLGYKQVNTRMNIDSDLLSESGIIPLPKIFGEKDNATEPSNEVISNIKLNSKENSMNTAINKKPNYDLTQSPLPIHPNISIALEGLDHSRVNDCSNLYEKDLDREIDIFEIKDKTKKEEIKHETILKIIENMHFQFIVFIFIIWALFARDFQFLIFPITVDTAFSIITTIAFFMFLIEITLTAIAKPEYRWSFFFFLDCISTITLIFDIAWIDSLIFNQQTQDSAQLLRAGRASRIGARAGRMVRIIRIIKAINIIKTRQTHKNKMIFTKENLIKPKNDYNNDGTVLHEMKLHNKDKVMKIKNNNESISNINDISENIPVKIGNNNIRDHEDIIISTITVGNLNNNVEKNERKMRIDVVNGDKKEENNHDKANDNSSAFIVDDDKDNDDDNEDEDIEFKESRIGKIISERTTLRVVFIVLLLPVIIPLFSIDFYLDDDESSQYMVEEIMNVYENNTSDYNTKNFTYWGFISQQSNAGYPIVYMNLSGMEYITDVSSSDLRDEEKYVAISTASNSSDTYLAIIDLRSITRLESGLSIGKTLFICLILVLGAFLFSRDVNLLVLRPLERMIEKINRIAKDPLKSKEQKLIKDHLIRKQNEIIQIENAVVKIGTLLALGFGDAGSEIISTNMKNGNDLNPMLPGKKLAAIFGFCDIRNFTDATEILQEEVMVFVNSIASIVHRYIDKYTGAANKNIGDAFLLVWKFPKDAIIVGQDDSLDLEDSLIVNNIADLSLISFLKIYARINKDPILFRYRDDPRLNSRLPNYRVKMGFGLHIGWAIEGAIGSEFKIDASYLSPNVNMASRLEAATKQYGVSLLFSGTLASKLSKETREKCRLIDIVTVKGSKKPIEIWTVDTNITSLEIAKPSTQSKEQKKVIQAEKKREIMEIFLKSDKKASLLFDTDKDLLNMVQLQIGPFYNFFNEGFKAYIKGNWKKSKAMLEECQNLNRNDGPTKTLYQVLEENDFKAPISWQGYRELTEKQQ